MRSPCVERRVAWHGIGTEASTPSARRDGVSGCVWLSRQPRLEDRHHVPTERRTARLSSFSDAANMRTDAKVHVLVSLGVVASRASSNPHSKRRADSQDVPCVRLTGHSHVSRPHDDVEQMVTPTHDEIAVIMELYLQISSSMGTAIDAPDDKSI